MIPLYFRASDGNHIEHGGVSLPPHEPRPEVLPDDAQNATVEVYEPKFKHIQEDLRYMFGIEITDESDLDSPVIKKTIYTKAIEDFLEGNPFSMEYFFEENLLNAYDINQEDIPKLRQAASHILFKQRHLVRTQRSKELFIKAGILTQEEVDVLSQTSK